MTHSPSLTTNKRCTTGEHLLDELKQAANSIPQSSTTTSGIGLASQYFVGCYPLLCRLLRDSLSRQQKCNISRSYPIHQNLCPSYVI
ncbi:unnamed protein product [Adineta steineri]|uniref:Uncharacterized protein n=1 Tax=Adineta steineri TaxID=433720 RepID=A0A814ITI9_9BILA|nr:unnamed protein product [Adineta steineri]CAF1119721.1 unnamed protein product [Adineta steineri]